MVCMVINQTRIPKILVQPGCLYVPTPIYQVLLKYNITASFFPLTKTPPKKGSTDFESEFRSIKALEMKRIGRDARYRQN